jgi:hypothetical protein
LPTHICNPANKFLHLATESLDFFRKLKYKGIISRPAPSVAQGGLVVGAKKNSV